ncbi:MAG: hypothetical protein HRU75_12590 [Planctomycetia bacterium]|nr:MAG: hypothetical protein HRU75_12590 [Planctomycetia bacterium]
MAAEIHDYRAAPNHRGRSARRWWLWLLLGAMAGAAFIAIFDVPLLRTQAAPAVDVSQIRGQRIDGADRITAFDREMDLVESGGVPRLTPDEINAIADGGSGRRPSGASGASRDMTSTLPDGVVRMSADDIDVNTIADIVDAPSVKAAWEQFEAWKGTPDQYRPVSFGVLSSFEYDPFKVMQAFYDGPPGAELPRQIPDKIAALNRTRIELRGFMLPFETSGADVQSFLLVRNRMLCCYGVQVNMNDWAHVVVKDHVRARAVQDVVVTVRGDFHVGETIEDGIVMSIFRVDADEVAFNTGF